jgi:hypothetical protein
MQTSLDTPAVPAAGSGPPWNRLRGAEPATSCRVSLHSLIAWNVLTDWEASDLTVQVQRRVLRVRLQDLVHAVSEYVLLVARAIQLVCGPVSVPEVNDGLGRQRNVATMVVAATCAGRFISTVDRSVGSSRFQLSPTHPRQLRCTSSSRGRSN